MMKLDYGLNIWSGLLYSEECLLGFCWLAQEKLIVMKIIFVQIYFLLLLLSVHVCEGEGVLPEQSGSFISENT